MRIAISVLLLASAGCIQMQTTTKAETKVKCGGDCLDLKGLNSADANAALLRHAGELLVSNRHASLDTLVTDHGEALLRYLRNRDPKHAPTEIEIEIARALDVLLQHPEKHGLVNWLQGASNIAQAEQILQRADSLTRANKWRDAANLLLAKRGALTSYPYQIVLADLILAEAQRRLGQKKESGNAWQNAAVGATHLATKMPIPTILDRLCSERPVTAAWPAQAGKTLATLVPPVLHSTLSQAEFPVESAVWFVIGNGRLQRSEVADALTAFRRAECPQGFAEWNDFLKLHQAKALLALEQTPAAISLLTGFLNQPGSPWRSSGLALLGAGKLQDGNTLQALAFLRESIPSSQADFLWRADAEANLGIAFLMTGNEAKGIEALHQAQERFGQTGRIGGLLLCLENEANYWQKNGRADEHRRVNERIRQIERQ